MAYNSLSVIKPKILKIIILSVVFAVANGCTTPPQPESQAALPSGVTVSQITELQTVENQLTQLKVFDQCGSTSPFKAEIQFSDSNSQTSQRQMVLTGSGGVEIGLPSTVRATLEGAIEQHIGSSITSDQAHGESVSIEVPARSRQEYQIDWRETRREGTVQYTENGETKTANYSYRIGLELVSATGRDLNCSGQSGEQAAVPPPPAAVTIAPTAEQQVVQTPTNIPPTAIPTPSLMLPFEENFDNGLRPEWRVLEGEPLFVNGRLTSASRDLVILQIGDESFGGNFLLTLDSYDREGDSFTCGPLEITIARKILFEFNYFSNDSQWAALKDGSRTKLQELGHDSCRGIIRISVIGNAYVVENGATVLIDGIYGDTLYGPLTIALSNTTEIDNLRISSP